MRRLLAASFALVLAGCGSGDPAEPADIPGDSAALPRPEAISPAQAAALESTDCRTVARAYLDAIALRDFAFAARFWDDPLIDDARLAALFAGYAQPSFEIADLRSEGAAGTLFCTVTGALSDLADPAAALREGEIVLRRANDVPGATPEQLRWTIRSSTFVEPMERSGKGEPA